MEVVMHHAFRSQFRFAAALCASAILPTAALAATEVHHVGAVDEQLYIGVAKAVDPLNPDRRAVLAYLCDSESVWSWVGGMVEGDAATFEDGRVALELDFTGETVSGNVTVNGGTSQTFSTEIAADNAGIFAPEPGDAAAEAEVARYIGGWIILLAGDQRGALTLGAARAQLGDEAVPEAENGWVFPVLDPVTRIAQTEFGPIAARSSLGLTDCIVGGDDCPLN